MKEKQVSLFWFRRDLRVDDNTGLFYALKSASPVLPLFIFDTHILDKLEDTEDRRLVFIHNQLKKLDEKFQQYDSALLVEYGKPELIFKKLISSYNITKVFANHDYEPYAIARDKKIEHLLKSHSIPFTTYKDQVVFEKDDIVKKDGSPYTVFTPYMKTWRATLNSNHLKSTNAGTYLKNLLKIKPNQIPSLKKIGFVDKDYVFPSSTLNERVIRDYHSQRDFPGKEGTSRLGVHLRFGTISIRKLVKITASISETYITELIWREFYMMLLWHFPHIVDHAFNSKFDLLQWKNDETDFQKWCDGQTGFPIVDAAMRELNSTGFMHNRCRMITAMFLTKFLLIDWRWGEAYFAQKLLDYELASNNGGWQWSAGTGADAAPYFRIFNIETQTKKFDPDYVYIKKWVPEFQSEKYPSPMIDYSFARKRCLEFFKTASLNSR